MTHSSRLHVFVIIGALLFLAATLNADTLVLRDGRRVQGQLISVRDGVIEFQEGAFGGRTARISRDDITSIATASSFEDRAACSSASMTITSRTTPDTFV